MRRHHYGKSRYDLVKAGCLTVRAKMPAGQFEQFKQIAIEFAEKIDDMSDFDFLWWTWKYEKDFKCKLGSTEMLVECMMSEKFLHDFWSGKYGMKDKLEEVIIEIDTGILPLGNKYDVAYWI